MSTFGGKIIEIPEISVDRFDGENVDATAYFLSHCHTDHMVGLSDFHFQEQVVEKCKYVYASQISCVILGKMYPYIKRNLKELCLYTSTSIHLKHCAISVTPIPAGHCPGSVMFLFEAEKCILYTGDYRINKNDISKFKPFYDKFGNRKNIHKIYLDTTFFSKKYPYFPKREDSLRELCKVMNEWILKGKHYSVDLNTSAYYGYEYLFMEIWRQTKMPIHVGRKAYEFYTLIPEMDQSVTSDGSQTQIHCRCNNFPDSCKFKADSCIKHIKISAFRWTKEELKEGLSTHDNRSHYVCYSTHASYEEGVQLVRFLRPKEIEACVLHNDETFNRDMLQLIDDLIEEIHEERGEEMLNLKLFDVQAVTPKKAKMTYDKSFDYLNILDSPPRLEDIEDCQEHQQKLDIEQEINDDCGENKQSSFERNIENSILLDILDSEHVEVSSDINFISEWEHGDDNENSIIMNIIDSQSPEMKIIGTSRQSESQEDSVILSIINSVPDEGCI